MRGKKKAKCCEAPEVKAPPPSSTVLTHRDVTVVFPNARYSGFGGGYVDCTHAMSITEARALLRRLREGIAAAEGEWTA